MPNNVTCTVHWSDPIAYNYISQVRIPRGSAVYVIMVENDWGLGVVRIGATKNVRQRMLNYKILNYIPRTKMSYFVIDKCISVCFKPAILEYYRETPVERWRPYLRQKSIDDCVAGELRSIEYKVERILIEEYRQRHGALPPGNPKRGSDREYLQGIQVVETSSLKIMRLKPGILSPISLVTEEILELIQ